MASSTYATPDAKKEEFRKYLDKSGVVDALTKGAWKRAPLPVPFFPSAPRLATPHPQRLPYYLLTHTLDARAPQPAPRLAAPAVLVGLYEEPERPPNAVEWVKKVLGAPVGVDVDALRADNERLKAMVASLQEQLEAARGGK